MYTQYKYQFSVTRQATTLSLNTVIPKPVDMHVYRDWDGFHWFPGNNNSKQNKNRSFTEEICNWVEKGLGNREALTNGHKSTKECSEIILNSRKRLPYGQELYLADGGIVSRDFFMTLQDQERKLIGWFYYRHDVLKYGFLLSLPTTLHNNKTHNFTYDTAMSLVEVAFDLIWVNRLLFTVLGNHSTKYNSRQIFQP